MIIVIEGIHERPDVFNSNCRPVAAILLDDKMLYKSPGFDFNAWQLSVQKEAQMKNESPGVAHKIASVLNRFKSKLH